MSELRSKIGKSSKAKGATAEREVRDIIQAWWRQLESTCIFARTPGSGGFGGFGGSRLRGDFKAAGDLMVAGSVHWCFTTEVKRREGWSDRELGAGRGSPVWSWWEQCVVAAIEEERWPMMWFRRSKTPWLVMLAADYVVRVPQLMPSLYAWGRGLNVNPHPVVYLAKTVLAVHPKHMVVR